MKINFNMSAIFANDNLRKTENALSSSIEKLSSGYKINHAKDNPAGIAIAKRMNAQIRGLSTASQSASDGISVLETADGALTEVHDILQRMNELSIKAANGTMSIGDRQTIQAEIDQLGEEVNRIANVTEFNGSVLMDGTFDLKGYVEKSSKDAAFDTSAVTIDTYSDEAKAGYYEVSTSAGVEVKAYTEVDNISGEVRNIVTASISVSAEITSNAGDTEEIHDKEEILKGVENQERLETTVVRTVTVTMVGQERRIQTDDVENGPAIMMSGDDPVITITGDNGFSMTMTLDLDKLLGETNPEKLLASNGGPFAVDWETATKDAPATYTNEVEGVFIANLTGLGAMTMQIGANEGQTLDIRIPTVSNKMLGIEKLNVTTAEDALRSIGRVSAAIDKLSEIRSRLGAYQNRLEHSVSSLDISEENMTAAYSRIMDVDMAEEMTQYTQQQVLTQAGTSILAQANERPSQVLQLLQ